MPMFSWLLACAASTSAIVEQPDEPEPVPMTAAPVTIPGAASQSTNDFAGAFYGELDKDGNLFFSPLSIQSAFGLAYAGANGETAQEIERVLRFAETGEAQHQAMGSLLQDLNTGGRPYELRVVNRLWGRKDLRFLDTYKALTSRFYGADDVGLDFAGDPDGSRRTINQWVEDATKDRIKDLLPGGSIDKDTATVLTNAIYFLGKWGSRFDPANTSDQPFHVRNGESPAVPLMYQHGTFGYASREDVEVLSLPYEGKALSMVVVLPKEGTDIRTLSVASFGAWAKELSPNELDLYLPRFEMTWGGSVKQPLKALGMVQAFSDAADFSGIYGANGVAISDVIHKAFVKVDEEGTEAAAATAILMRTTSVQEPLAFRADRPFLFAIRHDASGALLFVGRVMDPR